VHDRLVNPVPDPATFRVSGHLLRVAVMMSLVSLSNRSIPCGAHTTLLTPPHEISIRNVVLCSMCSVVLLFCSNSASAVTTFQVGSQSIAYGAMTTDL
jgi:hypothetical protein